MGFGVGCHGESRSEIYRRVVRSDLGNGVIICDHGKFVRTVRKHRQFDCVLILKAILSMIVHAFAIRSM